MKIGEGFLKALVSHEKRGDLRLEFAMFRDWEGEWTLSWVRTDSQGHEFHDDRAGISIAEDHGLLSFGLCWRTLYDSRPRSVMAASRALELAAPHAANIMLWPPAASRFHQFQMLGPVGQVLRIVNPNHILSLKDLGELGNPGDRHGRLAWVVTFRATYAGERPAGHLIPVDGEIDVWLDAETGEFLGGDFK